MGMAKGLSKASGMELHSTIGSNAEFLLGESVKQVILGQQDIVCVCAASTKPTQGSHLQHPNSFPNTTGTIHTTKHLIYMSASFPVSPQKNTLQL